MESTPTATRVQVQAKDQDHYLARSDSGICVTAEGHGRTDHRRAIAEAEQPNSTVRRLQLVLCAQLQMPCWGFSTRHLTKQLLLVQLFGFEAIELLEVMLAIRIRQAIST